MNEPLELTPLTLGDILERTISLLRRTFTRIGTIFLILAIPAALLLGVVTDGLMSAVIDAAVLGAVPETAGEAVLAMMGWIAFVVVAAIAVLVIDLITLVSIQIVVCGEIVGRTIGTREAFDLTLGVRLWRAVGQRLLAEVAVASVLVVPYVAIVAAVGLGGGAVQILAAAIMLLFGIGFMLYLRVRWAFGTTTIAWEDQGVLGAFGRSSELVRGEALRTFGIIALFAILIGVLASIITAPLQFFILKDIFMAGLNEARNVALQSETEWLRALSGIGFLYGVTVVVASLATTAIKSVYLPVLYFDLRARRGEFRSE